MKAKVIKTGEIIDVFQDFTQIMWYDKIRPYKGYHPNDLEFLPDTEGVTIDGFVARNHNHKIFLYRNHPERLSSVGYWFDIINKDKIELPSEFFPSITWQDSPKKVTIKITAEK